MTQISMKGIKFNIRNKFSLNPEVFKSRHGRNPEELKEIELKKSNPRPRGRPMKELTESEIKVRQIKQAIKELREKYKKIVEE